MFARLKARWFPRRLRRLRQAVTDEHLVLHAQPIAGICGNGIPSYELLLRLHDESGTLTAPAEFLQEAERLDVIGKVDRWVLAHAIKLLHEHAAAGHELSLAVNLSGKTINDPALAEELSAMLYEYPVPDGCLVIEVTETAAIDIERACRLASDLRPLGCRFALDDFGSGFSSFYYLKHVRFDFLKIDGEFIANLTETPSDQLVVKAIVDIAKAVGTQTIAEFVGDEDTVDLLRELGVDYGQGYHLGPPAPLSERLPELPSGRALLAGVSAS